jgi:hypothetical protein
LLNLAADAHVFGNDFGESVDFVPADGPERRLSGVNVEREDFGLIESRQSGTATPSLLIFVPNNSRTGVRRCDLDEGADKFRVSVGVGGTPSLRQIFRVVSEDNGMLAIALR